jgi:uncharacterized protein YciI
MVPTRKIRLFLPLLCLLSAAPPDFYYVVFLRPDPARKPLAKVDGERIMTAHMANIHRMADAGILVAAGPFEDTPTTISGVFVLRAASIEEARRIAAADPTVVEHRNTVDVHPWRGPAGIGVEYARLHKEHPETPENMGVHPLCLIYRGSAWEQKSGDRASALAAHTDHLSRLRTEGHLAAAGEVDDETGLLALVVFKRIPIEDARRLIEEDPAVQSGLLRPEYHRWWSADHVLPW